MDRPGMMIYFDLLDAFEPLSLADRGRFITAMLEFGALGVVPQFTSQALKMAWELMRKRLDRDKDKYFQTVEQREYAAFCKKRQQAGHPKIPIELWREMTPEGREMALCSSADNGSNGPLSPVNGSIPNRNTTAFSYTETKRKENEKTFIL